MEFTRPKGKVAISALKAVTELRRFMGMVNQMSKFLPNIAQISKPLHDPLKHQEFLGMEHSPREVLQRLKEEISSPRVLALYDVTAETKISTDASAHGLGAVLLQQRNNT